jgi:hypothetical protein
VTSASVANSTFDCVPSRRRASNVEFRSYARNIELPVFLTRLTLAPSLAATGSECRTRNTSLRAVGREARGAARRHLLVAMPSHAGDRIPRTARMRDGRPRSPFVQRVAEGRQAEACAGSGRWRRSRAAATVARSVGDGLAPPRAERQGA